MAPFIRSKRQGAHAIIPSTIPDFPAAILLPYAAGAGKKLGILRGLYLRVQTVSNTDPATFLLPVMYILDTRSGALINTERLLYGGYL